MTSIVSHLWSEHRIAVVSLAIGALEVIVVFCAAVLIHLIGHRAALFGLAGVAWICGSITTIILAIAAIRIDADRRVGVIALIISLFIFLFCGLQMMV